MDERLLAAWVLLALPAVAALAAWLLAPRRREVETVPLSYPPPEGKDVEKPTAQAVVRASAVVRSELTGRDRLVLRAYDACCAVGVPAPSEILTHLRALGGIPAVREAAEKGEGASTTREVPLSRPTVRVGADDDACWLYLTVRDVPPGTDAVTVVVEGLARLRPPAGGGELLL